MQFTVKSTVYFIIICKLLNILYVNKIYRTLIYVLFSPPHRMPAKHLLRVRGREEARSWGGWGTRRRGLWGQGDPETGDDNSIITWHLESGVPPPFWPWAKPWGTDLLYESAGTILGGNRGLERLSPSPTAHSQLVAESGCELRQLALSTRREPAQQPLLSKAPSTVDTGIAPGQRQGGQVWHMSRTWGHQKDWQSRLVPLAPTWCPPPSTFLPPLHRAYCR